MDVAGWRDLVELEEGDALLRRDGAVAYVVSVGLPRGPVPVYNLSVEGLATYYTGGRDVENAQRAAETDERNKGSVGRIELLS